MDIKLIIFDLDGTLADTLYEIRDAMNATLEYFGLPKVDYETVIKGINNGPRRLCCAMLPKELAENDAFVDRFCDKYTEFYGKYYYKTDKIYDGISGTVSSLATRGYKLAVLSNKQDTYVKHLVKKLFPNGEFCTAVGSVGELKKPDPALTISLIKDIDPSLSPKNCAFVGDSDVDVKTAHNAGLLAVGAAWGYRGRQFLAENKADIIIDAPQELLNIFEGEAS